MPSKMVTCEHCGSTLANSFSLKRHQQTKKCQQARGQPPKRSYMCEGCEEEFGRQDNRLRHIAHCHAYKDHCINAEKDKNRELTTKLQIQEDEIARLKADVTRLEERLSKRPVPQIVNCETMTTNNITVNLVRDRFEPLTEDVLSASSQQMHISHLQEGGAGMARLALATSLNGDWRVLVTDHARKKSMFKDENEEIVSDTEMCALIHMWCQCNYKRAEELNDEFQAETKETHDVMEYLAAIEPCRVNLFQMRQAAQDWNCDTDFCRSFAKVILKRKSTPGPKALMARAREDDTPIIEEVLSEPESPVGPRKIYENDPNEDQTTPLGWTRREDPPCTVPKKTGGFEEVVYVKFMPPPEEESDK